jgi:hypothetical protein
LSYFSYAFLHLTNVQQVACRTPITGGSSPATLSPDLVYARLTSGQVGVCNETQHRESTLIHRHVLLRYISSSTKKALSSPSQHTLFGMTTSISRLFAASAAVASTVAILHVLKIRNATSCVPTRQILSSASVPDSLRRSKAASITNPKGHVTVDDTRSITVNLPAHLTDEAILARFVRGFFGGHVFAPERGILQAVGRELTVFECKESRALSN